MNQGGKGFKLLPQGLLGGEVTQAAILDKFASQLTNLCQKPQVPSLGRGSSTSALEDFNQAIDSLIAFNGGNDQ